MTQSGNTFRFMCLSTCLTCIAATLIHIIAYATPYWIVSDGNSPFENVGWNEVCFDNCFWPYCPGGDPQTIYNGCYMWTGNDWLKSDLKFQEITTWLWPPWFYAAQNCFIANIILTMIITIMLIVCSCFAMAERYTTVNPYKKDRAALIIIFITLPLLVVSSLLNITGMAIFSSNGPRADYMPMYYKNHFGFSYWLDIIACILLSICSLTAFLAAIAKTLHMQGPKDPNYSEDMMLGRVAPTSRI